MDSVLVNVSSKEDYNFVKKLSPYFHEKDLKMIYFCSNIIIYLYVILCGEVGYVAFRSKKSKLEDTSKFSIFNIRSGISSGRNLSESVHGFAKLLDYLFCKYEIRMMVIPSGRMASHKVMTYYKEKFSIPAIYIGYGNLPGKTFLDCGGTDKASFLYSNISMLDKFDIDTESYREWKDEFVTLKLKAHRVPQSRNNDIFFKLKRFFRVLACKFENAINIAHDINYSFQKSNFSVESTCLNYKELPAKYVFFPMQLTTDAQVILNYDADLENAISEAISIARSKNLPLVVKAHPAEVDDNVNRYLNSLEEAGYIIISNENTFKVIDSCDLVVTINSTVGLEARILGRDVVFLGSSIFDLIPEERLGSYILGYLFDLEYFNDDPLSHSQFSKLDVILELSS